MAPRDTSANLPGISGGEPVAAGEKLTHGLGSKSELLDNLAKLARAQGVANYSAPKPVKKSEGDAGNEILVPLQQLLLEQADKNLPHELDKEAHEIVQGSVRTALRELLPAESMLYITPDDFLRIHQDLLRNAEQMVKETVALAAASAKKIPIHAETVTRSLRRELSSPKFKDRHHELFQYISRTRLPPEPGTSIRAPQ